jgi:hypothetical protein
VRSAIATELADGAGAAGDVGGDTELQVFLAQHEQASIELVGAVAARLEGSNAKLSSTIRTPFPTLRPQANDELMRQLVEVVDQITVLPTSSDANRRVAAIAQAAPRPVALSVLITRGLRFGSRIVATDDDPLVEQLEQAAAIGAAEVGLYNYGLLRDRDVRFFMAAVRQVFGRPDNAEVPT